MTYMATKKQCNSYLDLSNRLEDLGGISYHNEGIPLAKEIYKHKFPSLIARAAWLLSNDEIDALWESNSTEMRRALCTSYDFLGEMSDKIADDIMSTDDIYLCRNVAQNMNWIDYAMWYDEDDPSQNRSSTYRISIDKWRLFNKYFIEHTNPLVRIGMIRNQKSDPDFLPSLTECLNLGIEDFNVNIVKNLPVDILKHIASHTIELWDNNIKESIKKIIIEYPDPEVRLALE